MVCEMTAILSRFCPGGDELMHNDVDLYDGYLNQGPDSI